MAQNDSSLSGNDSSQREPANQPTRQFMGVADDLLVRFRTHILFLIIIIYQTVQVEKWLTWNEGDCHKLGDQSCAVAAERDG